MRRRPRMTLGRRSRSAVPGRSPGPGTACAHVVRPRRPLGVAALRLALRVPLTGALLAQVLLGRPAVRPDRCGGVELRTGGVSDGLIRGALRRWRGTRAAEAPVPGPAVVAETGPRARLTRIRHGVPPTGEPAHLVLRSGEPAQPQMAVMRVIVPEPPGNDHANPDRHDGGVQNGAAHGPSPRRGRCRADRGPPGRSEHDPGLPGAEAGSAGARKCRQKPAHVTQRKGWDER